MNHYLKKCKCSVIVPVYNAGPYLARSIESVRKQSFTDFELLLIDDGSTDESSGICDAFANKDSRIRAFHKANRGVSSARNLGLDNAHGEWVCFLDADDEMSPECLDILLSGVSESIDYVMAGYRTYDGDHDNQVVYEVKTRVSHLISCGHAVSEMFCPSDYKYQGHICGKLYRTSVINNYSLRFDETVFYNEDRLFNTQFICLSKKNAYYTTIPVYKYYLHRGSAMASLGESFNPRFVTDFKAQIQMRDSIRNSFVDNNLYQLADWGVFNSYKTIIAMMKSKGISDSVLKHSLRRELVGTIGNYNIAYFEIKRTIRRIVRFVERRLT